MQEKPTGYLVQFYLNGVKSIYYQCEIIIPQKGTSIRIDGGPKYLVKDIIYNYGDADAQGILIEIYCTK